MEDQPKECLKCLERREHDKDAKIDKIIDYIEGEKQLALKELERDKERDWYDRQKNTIETSIWIGVGSVALACLFFSQNFKDFMDKQIKDSN